MSGSSLSSVGIGAAIALASRCSQRMRGRLNGRSIVPEGWFKEAGAAHEIGGQTVPYGYMWWIADVGSFVAVGIFGQYMFINPKEHLAIVVLSARSKPEDTPLADSSDDAAFVAAVAAALH